MGRSWPSEFGGGDNQPGRSNLPIQLFMERTKCRLVDQT